MLKKLKEAYLFWYSCYPSIPKTHRYSLAGRIDMVFVESIEAIATASFLNKEQKLPYVGRAIQKTDTLNILLMVLWESKSLHTKKYTALSLILDEAGKMLGGWRGQLVKQNSPNYTGEK